MALSAKVTSAISHMRLDSLVVLMREVITSKPLLRVHHFDDGHRAHQEEDDLRRGCQRFTEVFDQRMGVTQADGIDAPQEAGADRCRG